jgi:hypothetical protein
VVIGAPILFGLILVLANLAVGVPDERRERSEVAREVPVGDALSLDSFTSNPGVVRIDVSECEFEIVPGEPGEPIRVEADYDAGTYELTESYTASGEFGWTYDVRFGGRRSLLLRLFSTEDIDNDVRLVIPPGVPFSLEGEIGFGESRLELGGLWMVDVDIDFRAGEHRVSFSEPGPVPARTVRLRGSFGEFDLLALGNASPAETSVSQTAGELTIGLEGAWRNDAAVDVRHRFGEIDFRRPDNARVEIDEASMSFGDMRLWPLESDEADADAPTIRLSVRSTAGEIGTR